MKKFLPLFLFLFSSFTYSRVSAQYNKLMEMDCFIAQCNQTTDADASLLLNNNYTPPILYGENQQGGISHWGASYQINPDGSGFQATNWNWYRYPEPAVTLIGYLPSYLCGVTRFGGTNDRGTVYKMGPNGSGYTTLYSFDGSTNGGDPCGKPAYDGYYQYLYGMTRYGGANGMGIIYKIRDDGTGFTKLLDFSGTSNGRNPEGSLIYYGGKLYGRTTGGGLNGSGCIFSINPDGTGYVKLHDFSSATTDGYGGGGSLITDNYYLYGMTTYGGANGKGIIFKMQFNGTGFIKLLDFAGASNGANPFGSLLLSASTLYGMTSRGGASDSGCVFKIMPDGTGYNKLFDFSGPNGSRPRGTLTTTSDGTSLYGIAENGGANNGGVVFKYQLVPITITTSPLSSVELCKGSTITVSYTVSGTINAGNYFYAQLSDANGSFLSATSIGSVSSISSGTITCTIPSSQSTGTGYRIRVVSNYPIVIGSDNGTNLSVSMGATGSVSGQTFICSPNSTSFTYSISSVTGADYYTWTVPSGWIIQSGQGTTSIQVLNSSVSGNVTVTPSNTTTGCQGVSSSRSVTVYAPIDPAGTISFNGPNPTCASGTYYFSVPAINGATSYTWTFPPGIGVVSGGSTNNVQVIISSSAVSGNVTVYGRNTAGCSGTISPAYYLNVMPIPNLYSLTGGGSYCAGGSGVPIGLSSSQIGVNYQLTLNSVFVVNVIAGTGSAISFGNITTAGTYKVNASYPATGCNRDMSGTRTVTVLPSPSVTTTTDPASCNGNDGKATAFPNGGVTPYTYLWNTVPVQTTQMASAIPSGSYVVTVTGANGCSVTATATVGSLSSSTMTTSTSSANNSCYGGNSGSASVNVSNGAVPYTYMWSPSGGTDATASNLAAGVYTVNVTDANGCTTSAAVTVTQPTQLIANGSVLNNIFCNGGSNGSAAAAVSGGVSPYSYQWTPSGGTSATAINLSAGTYTVNTTDANGCSTSSTVTVTQPSALSAAASLVSNVSCNGGTNGQATASVSGGTGTYSYSWSPSGGNGATASNLTAGTYTVNVTDANSCNSFSTITIVQPSALSSSASVLNNVTCNGFNDGQVAASVSGGIGPYFYSWSPSGGNAATASNLPAGTYTVSISDANGCNTSSSVNISQPSVLNANGTVISDVSCNGGNNGTATVTAGGGTAPFTYLWSPSGGNSSTANNLTAGTYTVNVTDAHGCLTSLAVTITQPSAIASSVTTVNPTCSLSNGSVDLTVSGGISPYTYSWSNGATTQDLSNIAAGTYSATIRDANGCIKIQAASITSTGSIPPATAVPSGNTYICRSTTGNVYSVPTVAGATSYVWTAPTGATITAGQNTNTVTLTFSSSQASGSLCVKAVNSCGNGPITCKTLTVVTAKPPVPASISGPVAGCPSSTATYTCPVTSNANTYTWTAPANSSIVSGQGTNTVTLSFTSSFTGGTLKVTAGNCIGNSSAQSITLYSIPGTPGNISGSNQACTNQTVAYSIGAVTGATTYLWTAPTGSVIASGQGTTSVTVTFGISGGTLSVRAGNACGYSNPKNKSINVNCTLRPEFMEASAVNSIFSVYPNPASDNVTIEADSDNPLQRIEIYSVDGKLVKSITVSRLLSVNVNLNEFSEGIYFFNCIGEKETEMVRVMKY